MNRPTEKKRVEIFCCCACQDQPLLSELRNHLKLWERQGAITIWTDTDIRPGTHWEKEIARHIHSAHLILFLVSSDFFASDYYNTEMKYVMERYERGEVHVIPIILRPCSWKGTPFGEIQALPTNAKPVVSPTSHTLDEAFADVAEGIRKVVIELQSMPSPNSSLGSPQASTPTQVALPPQRPAIFPPQSIPVQRYLQRSPVVVGLLILLIVLLLGGASSGIYEVVTGNWPWNTSHGQTPSTASSGQSTLTVSHEQRTPIALGSPLWSGLVRLSACGGGQWWRNLHFTLIHLSKYREVEITYCPIFFCR